MRSPIGAAGALAAVLALSACGSDAPGAPVGQTTTQPPSTVEVSSTSASTGSQAARCAYTGTPDDPAPQGKDVGLPPQAGAAPATVVLKTNSGDVTVTLSAKAPCTIRSFAHLAGKKFYDGSPCHRITITDGLKVLQCGDPTGKGTGGPGYTIPDENPTDLPPSPSSANASLYARGTVAMANTGRPNTGGSQFFIVYGDSALPPMYAVFGTVDAAGLATVDKIVSAGLDPSGSPEDGPPKNPVTIQQAVVGS